MTSTPVVVTSSGSDVVLKSEELAAQLDANRSWSMSKIDNQRFLIHDAAAGIDTSKGLGFALCTADMLYDLISGMIRRKWTGMIRVDTKFGNKKLYFSAGEFVFGASDLMDDRLGEVIYREEKITLDQLTNFAVQVDRKTKFGQVLLKSGEFTTTDVWNALKLQMWEIFLSVFLVDQSMVSVSEDTSAFEISFESGTENLLEAAYSFGSQFRSFCHRINYEGRVFPAMGPGQEELMAGTFVSDLIGICKDGPTIRSILDRSKLSDTNTLLAIHRLIALGKLRAEGLPELQPGQLDGRFSTLKASLDSYQFLHSLAVASFKKLGAELPIKDLKSFALSLNRDHCIVIYLENDGSIKSESMNDILQQCIASVRRISYFKIRIESLTRYLLQLAGDLLPRDEAESLRRSYREISK